MFIVVYFEVPVDSSTNPKIFIFQDFPGGVGTLCKLYN